MRYLKSLLLLSVTLTLISCDKGIEPDPENSDSEGFQGMITFVGNWPDSIKRTHLVVFKDPLNEVDDFNAFNLAYVSLEIPYGVSQYQYNTLDSCLFPINAKLASGTYSYVAVAQQKTEIISLNRNDWYVVGLYFSTGSNDPGVLHVPEGTLIKNVNITCDFGNPPPQPPGGVQNE